MFCLSDNLKKIFLLSIGAGMLALSLLILDLPDGKNHLYFFDVGQGDSALFVTEENHQILVDGGQDSSLMESLSQVVPFFDRSLDLVILSHPHADHMGGLIEVLKRYKVDRVMITGVEYKSSIYQEFLSNLNEEQVLWADSETDLSLGGLTIDVLFPPQQILLQEIDNLNNSSIVFKAEFAENSVLFTGDIEKEVEAYLLKHTDVEVLNSEVLKVAHHGSLSSSRMSFLKAVSPNIAVIQSGRENRFGHPHQEVLDRLKNLGVREILRNDLEGMIEFIW